MPIKIYVSSKEQEVKNGRLWLVTPPGANKRPNVVLGTTHLEDELIGFGTPELNALFVESTKYFFEMPDPRRDIRELIGLLTSFLKSPSCKTIDNVLQNFIKASPREHEEFCRSCNLIIADIYVSQNLDNPYTEEIIRALNPILLQEIISGIMMSCDHSHMFDGRLFSDALKRKEAGFSEAVASIENVEDALNSLLSIPANLATKDDLIETLNWNVSIFSYLSSILPIPDISMIAYENNVVSKTYNPEEETAYEVKHMQIRNRSMLAKVTPHFENGGCFLASGLAHCLFSNECFIDEFKKRGYKIERVYETTNTKGSRLNLGINGTLSGALLVLGFAYLQSSDKPSVKDFCQWVKNCPRLFNALVFTPVIFAKLENIYNLFVLYNQAPRSHFLEWYNRSQRLYTPGFFSTSRPLINRSSVDLTKIENKPPIIVRRVYH